jgi:spermidine synthase
MLFRLLIVGLISILGQVVLLRELAVSFYGIELIYVLSIGIWLLGTGSGAIIRAESFQPKSTHVSMLLLSFSVFLLLDIGFVRGMRLVFGGVSGAYLSFPQQLTGLVLALFPIGFLSGLLFQWSAKSYLTNTRTAAGAYAIESIGGVFGGLLSTLLLAAGIQNSGTALLCAIIAVTPLIIKATLNRSERLLKILAFVFMAGCALLLADVSKLDRLTAHWNHPNIALTRDTPYGRVTVEQHEDQISVFENDVLSFETEGTSAEEIAHLAMLAHAQPKSVLILGGALEGMLPHVLQHNPQKVDYVELNGRMLRAVLPMLSAETQNSLSSPRVHFREGDPRRELTRLGQYDVILMGIAEPASGQTNRFFTREFFRMAAAHLNPHGILAFRLRSAENFWSEPLTLRNASVVRALEQVFTNRLILPGGSYVLLAANDSLPPQPEQLENRFNDRDIRTRLVNPAYIRYLFANDRRTQSTALLAAVSVAANADERPVSYHYAAMIWLSKFYPALLKSGGLFAQHVMPWHIIAVFSLAVFAVTAFLRRRGSRIISLSVLTAVAGGCGMILETVLLLRFQSVSGVLYQDIGLLLTLFMLGLSIGAGVLSSFVRNTSASHLKINSVGTAVLAFFVLLAMFIAWRIRAGGITGLAETGSALVLCGAAVAAIFGYAGAAIKQAPGRIIGLLYSADLIGGCLGSLAASLILIPVAGLVWSAVLCALLCVASTLVLVADRK